MPEPFLIPSAAPRLTDAMRHLAGGVAVITVGRAPNRSGYTGTAVFSLSVNPERVIISIGRQSSSYPLIRQFGVFGLNLLGGDQRDIADRFAGRGSAKGEARYDGASWIVTERGVSLLSVALATAECAVEEIIERHSHALIIGEPLSITTSADRSALVYWRSGYRAVEEPLRVAAE
jgi:flavin reductase (DIM6/NTAB) family NADH-FMN oxidoreductase RutF